MVACSGNSADSWPVTRRSVIGGVVGAGLLEVLSLGLPVQNAAMADDPPIWGSADGDRFTADAPRVYTRAQWRARPARRPAKVLNRRPDHIVIHHTATANSRDTSLAHAFALSRFIQSFHMNRNGWDDAGQQLTISRGGIVMEGRNRSLRAVRARDLAVGAQVLHHNSHTIGIENEGTYSSRAVPRRLWHSLVEVCVWLCRAYDLEPRKAIVGHRDLNNTACPGDALYAKLPALRRSVSARLGGSPDQEPTDESQQGPENSTDDSGFPVLPSIDDLT
ncbi:peptidoglycan recognition protein family protein [Actinomadura decatromicini]